MAASDDIITGSGGALLQWPGGWLLRRLARVGPCAAPCACRKQGVLRVVVACSAYFSVFVVLLSLCACVLCVQTAP